MTTIDAVLVGAVGMALLIVAGYFLFLGFRKTWQVAKSMEVALKAVPEAVAALKEVAEVASGFKKELELMRMIAVGDVNLAQQQANAAGNIAEVQEPAPRPEYPAPFLDRFPKQDVPDAEVKDTSIFAQTDEEMAGEEKLENLIEMGMAHRDEVQPPGREVDSN
jgi:hypothetical protein